MTFLTWARTFSDTLGGAAGHADGAQYALAYLSSSGVEILAAAVGLAVVLHRLARGLFGAAEPRPVRVSAGALTAGHGRPFAGFDPASLFKLVIPMSCLVFIGWIWVTMSGS